MLILPGDPEFDFTLGSTLPPNWRSFAFSNPEFCFVVDAESGILRPANKQETDEYLYGGEYDQRLSLIGEDDCYYG